MSVKTTKPTDKTATANATLAAIREPTNEMLFAGYRADGGIHATMEDFLDLDPGWIEDQRHIWRAMIDAALEDATP